MIQFFAYKDMFPWPKKSKYFTEAKDFVKASELLNIRVIEVKEEVHLFEKICPAIYLSSLSVKIRRMVCHRYMRGTMMCRK